MLAVREHLGQLGDSLPVVVTFTDDPARLTAYREHLGLDFPVVADVDRTLYRRLGVGRGSLRRVWSLGTLRMYGGLILRGRRLRRPTEDTRQLGADVVVDRDGRIAKLWIADGPDDRPDVREIVAAVGALR